MEATAFRGLRSSNHLVLTHSCPPKHTFQSCVELRNSIALKPVSNWRPMMKDKCSVARHLPICHVSSSMGRNHIQLKLEDEDYPQDPSFVRYFKEAFRSMRLLFIFLYEQPGQLKDIEWPSFQSTLKTASLTLVLVAMLIVVLSSVDSLLSLMLTLILRRKA